MAAALQDGVVGVRDWAYLVERYEKHPVNHYECLLVRHLVTRQPKGVIVLRDHGPDSDSGIEILDLIGDFAHWPHLVRAARRRAAANRRKRAYLWTTRSHAALLADTSPTENPLELMVPANVWTPGPSAAELQGKWWLTGGDTDFR
jgi:hypothetical protein